MLDLDGGEAGGQFLRSALALATLQGRPVRIENVRGGRSEPGLRPQHLAVVEVLAEVCTADVTGAEVGSETVTFDPERPRGGTYEVDIGTAGSLLLVFDAVLPIATAIETPLHLRARGGTDVKWAPTAVHYCGVKLPVLRAHGLGAAVELEDRGFYPAGGGRATLHLWPSTLERFALSEFGELERIRVRSFATPSLGEADVATRQARAAIEALPEDRTVTERTVGYVEAASPGSTVCVILEGSGARAGFDALGERGRPAEDVGGEAGETARSFLDGTAAVDRYLADQLLVPVALAGGTVAIPEVTDHVATGRGLLEAFDRPVALEHEAGTPILRRD